MSGDDDDVICLDGDSCQKLVEEFVKITDTNEALAQFYLQDREWKLGRSVNDFFEDAAKEKGIPLVVGGKEVGEVSVSLAKRQRVEVASEGMASSSSVDGAIAAPSQLRFITWNIDGLDQKNVVLRTKAVCANIKAADADIVFLQEVIEVTQEIIKTELKDYLVSSAQAGQGYRAEYYTITLFKKATVEVLSTELVEYCESEMTRNMLTAKVKFANITINLINTHLESTKDFTRTRVRQLKQAFEMSSKFPKEEAVIFAGDLNLRDKEVSTYGSIHWLRNLQSYLLYSSKQLVAHRVVWWMLGKPLVSVKSASTHGT